MYMNENWNFPSRFYSQNLAFAREFGGTLEIYACMHHFPHNDFAVHVIHLYWWMRLQVWLQMYW